MRNFLLIICLVISGASYSQCKNSIKIVDVSKDVEQKGSIEVLVSTSGEFACVLYIESGSGPKRVEVQKSYGTGSITFKKLDTNTVYLVEVEFFREESKYCQKLQKSGITFEE